MPTKVLKIILSVGVLTSALGGLMYSSLRGEAAYYKHVDEVMPQAEAWYGKNMQLHGFVVEEIQRKRDSLDYRFKIQFNGTEVQAMYTGVVPDTLKTGSEVVLKGQLAKDGFHVESKGVMAKCPSKYDPAKTGPGAGGR